MIALSQAGGYATGSVLPADLMMEFHASRVLLLLSICGGKKETVEGLTKFAKLDFFCRYPSFFGRVSGHPPEHRVVESVMIRYHYGPWDMRYYDVLAWLSSRALIIVSKKNKKSRYDLSLTPSGSKAAREIRETESFLELADHMKKVHAKLGRYSGNKLKTMIYHLFEQEISDLPSGRVIES